jgi:hypothetical protein
MTADPDPIGALTRLACGGHDQAVQKAAVSGLSKHSGAKALLGIARRLLDPWGISTISHCIKVLGKMADRGGLILLSSTLHYDNRFVAEELAQMRKAFDDMGDACSFRELEILDEERVLLCEPSIVDDWTDAVEKVANQDVRRGGVFGALFEIDIDMQDKTGWEGKTGEKASKNETTRAVEYVESRIPGLNDLYRELLNLKS